MITGLGSAKDLASGNKGAFYNTLEEFSKYWTRIDIICPKINNINSGNSKFEILNPKQSQNSKSQTINLFDNIFIHISPWPLMFHPLWFIKKGLEIYREQKFNLMTVQDYPPFYNGIGARLLWQRIKVPYVLEFHHISGYPKAANFKEKIYANEFIWKLYWRLFGSKARAVRVVNQKQTPEFLKKVGVPEDKMFYIPSMYVDLDTFKPIGLSKEYDIIFVGRLEPNKGVDLLIGAVRNLKSQISNLKCLVVGDGLLRGWIQSQITNYQLPITNYGRAKNSQEIAELINRSKILVMPSYNEGGPRVVLEAMACGVPVLVTNVGLMPDFAGHNSAPDFADKNGVKIIDWDAADIAKKAQELLENENEREKLSQAGMEIAKQFEKKNMVKDYANKLKELIVQGS